MGGNVWELTTESCSLMYGTYTSRGGDYYDHFADGPAGSRGGDSGNASGRGGFRLTLFL